MWRLSVVGVRWLDDEPQPGWVEVEFIDSAGIRHALHGKSIDFSATWSAMDVGVPEGLEVQCEVIEQAPDETVLISIDTLPWLDEGTTFRVRRDQVRRSE